MLLKYHAELAGKGPFYKLKTPFEVTHAFLTTNDEVLA